MDNPFLLCRFNAQYGCFIPFPITVNNKANTFVCMARLLPIKNLVKLNWTISFMTSILVVIFFVAITHDLPDAAIRFLQTFLFMCMTSFCNLVFLIRFSKGKRDSDRYSKIKFCLCSYFCSVIIWILARTLYSALTGLQWEGEGSHVYRAYMLAVLAVWVLNTFILILQQLVVLQHRKAQSEIENLQLQTSMSETANLLLRQQVHPHFLFNALNTIKSLYKKDLQQGEDYLVHLANFLRVSISNYTTETTLIRNEMEFCMDYLQMQKIRFGDALGYSIAIPEQICQTKYLPFFSLQPLIENALKHNELTEERPILITIKEENGYLLVSNNLQLRGYKEISTGQGLPNLTERYRLLGAEEIVIRSDNYFFTVSIKILDK